MLYGDDDDNKKYVLTNDVNKKKFIGTYDECIKEAKVLTGLNHNDFLATCMRFRDHEDGLVLLGGCPDIEGDGYTPGVSIHILRNRSTVRLQRLRKIEDLVVQLLRDGTIPDGPVKDQLAALVKPKTGRPGKRAAT